ncbi:unnamed protein product [Adineta ricciae]|uniref:G-protein coupled receptors family 1 profile domain-containing protein n=1 Tax=Adineta ricciae TaxID=249248 RepID=A0A814Q9X3_ADIRI|nr:unnamed protein product [Adineta ricciae]CAF1116651.1 unnamed protein product [Adineta ricciae]
MTTVQLASIGTNFTIYAGSVLFSLGFSGNIVTIYIFRKARNTPITFILIMLSIANCLSLIVGLLNRILVAIVGIDPTLVSPIWCKLRVYIGQTSVLICQSCACLASVNCFLTTSRDIHRRRLVSLTRSRLSVLLIVILWLVHGLFNPILTELVIIPGKSSTCSLTNLIATTYTGFFLRPILIGVFPISILSIFGMLTYRNLHLMHHRRRFDQQIVCKMLLFQMIAYVVGTAPYASFYAYQTISSTLRVKSTIERAQESLSLDFINIIFYTPQASPFYVYYLSSGIFRKQVKDLFTFCAHNRVTPIAGNDNTEPKI